MRITIRSKNYMAAVLGLKSQAEPLRVGGRWLHKKLRSEGKLFIKTELLEWLN